MPPLPAVGDNGAMEAEPPTVDPPKRRRRWFQFSLRTLLSLVTLLAAACAYFGWQERIAKDGSEMPSGPPHRLTAEAQMPALIGKDVIVVGRVYLVDKNFGIQAGWMRSFEFLKCDGTNPRNNEGVTFEARGTLKKEAPYSVRNIDVRAQVSEADGDYPGDYYLSNVKWTALPGR